MSRRWLPIVLGLIAALGVAAFSVVMFGADIDNNLRIYCDRDLRLVQELRLGGNGLYSRIQSHISEISWSAYHAGDAIYLTVVDCRGYDKVKREVVLSWEVAHNYSPSAEISRNRLRVTPLTREAAVLTPELVPMGLVPDDYPDTKYRLFNSSAVFGLAKLRASSLRRGEGERR